MPKHKMAAQVLQENLAQIVQEGGCANPENCCRLLFLFMFTFDTGLVVVSRDYSLRGLAWHVNVAVPSLVAENRL